MELFQTTVDPYIRGSLTFEKCTELLNEKEDLKDHNMVMIMIFLYCWKSSNNNDFKRIDKLYHWIINNDKVSKEILEKELEVEVVADKYKKIIRDYLEFV